MFFDAWRLTWRTKSKKICRRLLYFTVLTGLISGCADPGVTSNTQQQTKSSVVAASSSTNSNTQNTQSNPSTIHLKGSWVTVTHVSDGDTIKVDGNKTVRLIGINTPETVKPNTPVQPYGKEASDFTKSQLSGKKVFLELDVQTTDKYGRTLGYIFLQEPKTTNELEAYMFNAILLKEGYAQLMTIPPNVKYAELLVKLERQAHDAKKGLWSLGIYKDSTTSTNDVFLSGKAPVVSNTAEPEQYNASASQSNSNTIHQSATKQRTVVTILSVSNPVPRNGTAKVTAKVAPGATTTIEVDYKSGPSHAKGLGPHTADANGNVSWSWNIGSSTDLGTWPITVTCNGIRAETQFTIVQ